jgi:hypothetical protein
MRRTSSLVLATFLAAFTIVGLVAAPVSAHGDVGVIEVDAPEPTGDLAIALRIRLTFENDAEPVAEDEVSEISVDGVGPDGATIGPETGFAATDVPGVYSVDLTFPGPGSWDLTITSVEPDATATTTVEVADVVTSTTGPDDTADTTEAADDDATTDTTVAGTAEIVERGDDDQTPLLVTLVLAAVVIAGAVGVVLFWRRRNRAPGPDSPGSGEESGGAAT